MRNVRLSEKLLLLGYSFILLFMIAQDWVPLGPLNDIDAIRQEKTTNELVMITLIGVIQIALFIFLILLFIGKRYPMFIKLWLVIHPSCIFAGVLMSWWIPYFTGNGAAERIESYTTMFGNTHTFLPVMNGIAPNTLHFLVSCYLVILYSCISLYFSYQA